MKPIKLVIEGLNSFTEPQIIDFEAVGRDNIFCISGVTGSGKTTILDAIILSLYKNMKYRGNLEDYVNLRYQTAKISFTFELNGEIYTTERTISRKGKNVFVLRVHSSDGTSEPVCEGDAAYELLKQKIGLDAGEFTNVVVLQQGEFAKFLKSTKAERVKLISKLFSLERFDGLGSKFSEQAKSSRAKLEACEKALESFACVTDESVKETEAQLAEVAAAMTEKQKTADQTSKEKERLVLAFEEYRKQIELGEQIKATEAKIADLTLREKRGSELLAQLCERERELAAREKERDALVERRAVIAVAAEDMKRLTTKFAALENRRTALLAVTAKAQKARQEYARIEAELVESERVLDKIRKENAVAAVHASLNDGDECPVCGGVYHAENADGKYVDLSKKMSELAESNEVLRKKAENAKNTATSLNASVEVERKAITEVETELNAERAKLLEKGAEQSEKTLAEIDEKLKKLIAEREEIDKTKENYEKRLRDIQSELIAFVGVIESKKKEVKKVEPVTEESVNKATAAAIKASDDLLALVGLCASLKERAERSRVDLQRKKELSKERIEHKRDYEKHESMRTLFHGNEFSMFVAAEYIKDFTVAASEQLGLLTGGKYSLSYEEESGDFYVTDFLSGNEKRKVSTLSGGETFLASLSLAVAISRELSRERSYDFFFIDEGFGTLSPDAIELVTNALITLSKDCLVGVITHRSELIERLPFTLRVEGADGDNGSRVAIIG